MNQLHLQRLLYTVTLTLVSLLSACGGSSSTVNPLVPSRVIAFGDGFNAVDAAGYGVNTVQAVVGTDLPDDTIAGRLAYKYGITLTGVSGAGVLDPTQKGFSYAQGAARIRNADTLIGDSVETQIDNFLTANTVGEKDLFIISAGSLDIYDAFTNSTALTNPVDALVTAIKRLTVAGAKYVLIVYPPNMARTPWAINLTSAERKAIQDLSYDTGTTCTSFSCRTTIALNIEYPATSSRQPILVADLMGYSNLVTGTRGTGSTNTFPDYGVGNPDSPACNTVATPPAATLTCDTTIINAANGVNTGTNTWNNVAWDYKNSVFADNFYYTAFANRLMGNYIYNLTMYRAGWR
jgi:hypothetical protein